MSEELNIDEEVNILPKDALAKAKESLIAKNYSMARVYAYSVKDLSVVSYNYEAFWVRLLCDYKCPTERHLFLNFDVNSIASDENYKKIMEIGGEQEKNRQIKVRNNVIFASAKKYFDNKNYLKSLEFLSKIDCAEAVALEQECKEQLYLGVKHSFNNASTIEDYKNCAKKFLALGDFNDSLKCAEECKSKVKSLGVDNVQEKIDKENADYLAKIKTFKKLHTFRMIAGICLAIVGIFVTIWLYTEFYNTMFGSLDSSVSDEEMLTQMIDLLMQEFLILALELIPWGVMFALTIVIGKKQGTGIGLPIFLIFLTGWGFCTIESIVRLINRDFGDVTYNHKMVMEEYENEKLKYSKY